jgi:hypothetical protein
MNIVGIIFYLFMTVIIVYSLIAIYSLLSYGKSRILGLTVTILYLIILVSLYGAAISNLNQIKL